MEDTSELNQITFYQSNESQHQLLEIKKQELIKLYKLQLILSIIKSAKQCDIKCPDGDTVIKRIKYSFVKSSPLLNDSGYLLNLENCCDCQPTYLQRKCLQDFIEQSILKQCTPILNYATDVENSFPGIFDSDKIQNEILELEEKRRGLQIRLLKVKNEKCEHLKECAEYQLSQPCKSELELMHLESRRRNLKANLMLAIQNNEFVSRTSCAMKAIKEVESYMSNK